MVLEQNRIGAPHHLEPRRQAAKRRDGGQRRTVFDRDESVLVRHGELAAGIDFQHVEVLPGAFGFQVRGQLGLAGQALRGGSGHDDAHGLFAAAAGTANQLDVGAVAPFKGEWVEGEFHRAIPARGCGRSRLRE